MLRRPLPWVIVLAVAALLFFTPSSAYANDQDPGWWGWILRNFFDWMMGFLEQMASAILDTLWQALPEQWGTSLAGLAEYLATANAWIPLDLGATLLGLYFGFLAVFVTVKFVLKLIPTIG